MNSDARGCVMDLKVQLGPMMLQNPILVASGTFGYAREMAGVVDFSKLGGIIPKTVTVAPRAGNPAPRTVETASGMLNAIGLDNDGIDYFATHHWPYLQTLPTTVFINIAGKSRDEFVRLAEMACALDKMGGLELNLSCPNVSGGIDFATDPQVTKEVVKAVRSVAKVPLIAKLTPNVTQVVPIAQAAMEGGADALSLVNTFLGMAIDWRRKRPVLGNITGGLSGPAIKPLALRIVWQVAQKVKAPIIGVGGIQNVDDVMEYLLAGATAVQVGTANFYSPTVAEQIISDLPEALACLGVKSVQEVIGQLETA